MEKLVVRGSCFRSFTVDEVRSDKRDKLHSVHSCGRFFGVRFMLGV